MSQLFLALQKFFSNFGNFLLKFMIFIFYILQFFQKSYIFTFQTNQFLLLNTIYHLYLLNFSPIKLILQILIIHLIHTPSPTTTHLLRTTRSHMSLSIIITIIIDKFRYINGIDFILLQRFIGGRIVYYGVSEGILFMRFQFLTVNEVFLIF